MAQRNPLLTKISKAHRISRPSPANRIPYNPISPEAALWQSKVDVLAYLVEHPEDRTYLIAEAQHRSPQGPRDFYVDHPLLQGILKVNAFDSEWRFWYIIQDLIWKIEYPRRVRQILDNRAVSRYKEAINARAAYRQSSRRESGGGPSARAG